MFEERSAAKRRERQTTANQMLIEVSPNRSYSDSALIVLVALDPTEIMKNCSDSQIITDLMHKSEKQEKTGVLKANPVLIQSQGVAA